MKDTRFTILEYHDDRPLPFAVVKLTRDGKGISGEVLAEENFATKLAAASRAAGLQLEHDAID